MKLYEEQTKNQRQQHAEQEALLIANLTQEEQENQRHQRRMTYHGMYFRDPTSQYDEDSDEDD